MQERKIIGKELTEIVIGAAIEVHKHWGPGLYEEIYERSLCCELTLKEIAFENQLYIPLVYKDNKVGEDLKLDFCIDRKLVVEIKAVTQLLPVHEAQLLTYMKLANCRVGLLINFNVPTLIKGIKRFVL
jgi:GxxExxY protein